MATSTRPGLTQTGTVAPRWFEKIRRRWASGTFLRAFAVIVIAELLTMLLAWWLLNMNANRWIQQRVSDAVRVSKAAANANDWSQLDQIQASKDSALFRKYQNRLIDLNAKYFPHLAGSVFLVKIDNGEEYQVAAADTIPWDDDDKANQWEIEAYRKHETTFAPSPIVDNVGTYLGAYTPVINKGQVIGLVAAEIDEAPLTDFQAIVTKSFWYSIIPAVIVSMVVAAILASMFVEPTDVLREIEETAQARREQSPVDEQNDVWHRLSPSEKEIAELLRQGLERTKDLAQARTVSPETIKKQLASIKDKTGWSKQQLAMQAAARRSASAPTA